MSLRDYVDFSRSNPSTRLCCTEYDTPARVLTSFELPDICRVNGAGEEILGLPRKYGDFDLVTAIFLANEGNVGHLHFDGDQRDVLLYQVYGRKRVVLVPAGGGNPPADASTAPTRARRWRASTWRT